MNFNVNLYINILCDGEKNAGGEKAHTFLIPQVGAGWNRDAPPAAA
jgi:hypothetical protein